MKKLLLMLFCALFLGNYLNANECICFELKGEFGEEIKAIMQKYSKNLGSKDIKVVREDADLSVQEKSFLDSLLGTGQVAQTNKNIDIENGKKLYDRDCASCHGEKGELSVAGKPAINTWSAKDIAAEIKSYQNQNFQGQSQFIKNQVAQRYTSQNMQEIGAYLESLK
ncbi:MAG: c-type cytochrome [Helicobacter sp.]|nr:c-type cytochrome [Helicobacteraceae bacterium]MDY3112926.1 c-type cytochrome [Helicobacter sp.]